MATVEQTPATAAILRAELENAWHYLDQLFGLLTPQDWSRKHGKDWTFADLPYHLAYFDRDLVAKGIERGATPGPEEQRLIRTQKELNAWNAQKFAERPTGQTVEQSLEQMRAARDAIRRLVTPLNDADLARPAWMPIFFGWGTVRDLLVAAIAHNWSDGTQLRIRMGRSEPLPDPAVTHRALGFYAGFFPLMLNQEAAAKTPFTGVMEFTGPGGGAWTLRVAEGTCTVSEGWPSQPDLVMTQSPETFVKTLVGIQNPMIAMLTRKIKVRGLRKMGTFGKLFPTPKADTVLGRAAQGKSDGGAT